MLSRRRLLSVLAAAPAGVWAEVSPLDKIAATWAQLDWPASLRAMREIHGVGDTKLERYGAAFLEVVQAHPR